MPGDSLRINTKGNADNTYDAIVIGSRYQRRMGCKGTYVNME